MTRKTKSLHHITIEKCQINTKLSFNLNTNHCGIGNEFNYRKEQKKQYYQNNKEQILKQVKKYYFDNRDQINKRHNKYNKTHNTITFLNKQISTTLPKVKFGYVYHHVIYDHLNKDKYVVMMLVNKHKSLHAIMRRNNIEISHINVRINDFRGF